MFRSFLPFTLNTVITIYLFFFYIYSVNSAFDVLRTMIPIDPPDRKLSKIETLQLATKYINHLSQLLNSGKLIIVCYKISLY